MYKAAQSGLPHAAEGKLVPTMSLYWDSPPPPKSSSSNLKIMAVLVIVMFVVASGMIILLPLGNAPSGIIRVAVVDSGVNVDYSLTGKVVASKSFVSTSLGYDVNVNATEDSEPENVPHGTIVAKTVIENSPNAVIVNAKVLGPDGLATASGIVAAIYWAIEQNCSVINLSLGGSPTVGDPIEGAVEYAFTQGVVVVAAAGNEGDDGVAGTSINSPSVYQHALSVGGLDEFDTPAGYSSLGPTSVRTMKPDISAEGYTQTSTAIYFGTSFASPRVAAAVVDLIVYCESQSIPHTPGSVMTALMKSAESLNYPSYLVGAGKIDLQAAKNLVSATSENQELPEISYAHPGNLPVDFENLFYGDTYLFDIQIHSSGMATYDIDATSNTPEIFDLPSQVTINQTGFVSLVVNIPDSGPSMLEGRISFVSSEFGSTTVEFSTSVDDPVARVAFDISHTTWSIDTTYGQFKELYREITLNDISVTEVRDALDITFSYLQEFDAVLVLDPCIWDIDESDPTNTSSFSTPYSTSEIQAYHDYYDAGGGIFVASLSNRTTDVDSLNDFLGWTGFSFDYSRIPHSLNGPVQVTNIFSHAITVGISSFDYLGAPISVPAEGTTLARYGSESVFGCLEGGGGGRLVVTGTNYFLDNWGMLGHYNSDDNDDLSLRVVLWISGLL